MTAWRMAPGTAWGAWVKLEAIESPQILAASGFDFVVVDLEHTLLDLGDVARHLAVGQGLGLTVLVRVPDQSSPLMQRLLDAGADGLIIPHVDSAAEAAHAVAATRFSPHGHRGSGGTSRAGGWGRRARTDYLEADVVVLAQIESRAALADAASIAATPGISGVMLGSADLALDAGAPVVDADKTLAQIARTADVAVGSAGTRDGAERAVSLGLDFFVCAADSTLLAQGAAGVIEHVRSLTPSDRGELA